MRITLEILDTGNGMVMEAVDFGCFMVSTRLCEVFLDLDILHVIIQCILIITAIIMAQIDPFMAQANKEEIIMAQIVLTPKKETLLFSKGKQETTIGHHHEERLLHAEAEEVAVLVTENNYGTHQF